MRYLLFLLLPLLLLGCQSQAKQSTPGLAAGPPALPSPSPVPATLAAMMPTETDETSSPAATVTQTGVPLPAETQEPLPGYPVVPVPTALPTAYPDPIAGEIAEPIWSYRIVNEYPHDSSAYTQGLLVEVGLDTLLEGTGRESSLRRLNLQSGDIEQSVALPEGLFGEGITLFEDRIIQLTWRAQTGFVYDSKTFEPLNQFYYPHEGWGLTDDGSQLIVSDGSDIIRFWNPQTFQEERRIQVTSINGPVTQLNELVYVDGEIWANIWHSDRVARISPDDGRVLGWVDLSGLLGPILPEDPEAVLNGIAYDEESGRLFITGKLWPSLFEIEVVESGES